MSNKKSWKGTSLKIEPESEDGKKLIEALKTEKIPVRTSEGKTILENQSNYYVHENEFINKSTNISSIIKKYSYKAYNQNVKIYKEETNSFESINSSTDDMEKYKKVLSENILDGDERTISISVKSLKEIIGSNERGCVFLDILILFALCTKSSYDAETLKSELRVEDKSEMVDLNIIDSKPLALYPIYDWVFDNEEYEEAYNVKLHVVRQVIVNRGGFGDVEEIVEDSKLAYKRIISQKTNEYFEQLNNMKNDFLTMSRNKNNVLRTLNLTFFAWMGYLGIELFNIVSEYEGNDIVRYLVCSQSVKKGIIILMFIVALIFVFMAYVIEIKSLRETYEGIKGIYKNKILFEGESENINKFETIIIEPTVGNLQKIVFVVSLIILVIRFGVAIRFLI